jgi:formate-dependent nitrite reductase membrane component NrfD
MMESLPVNEATEYVQKRVAPAAAAGDFGYYGLPMLKRPLWGWEIALYFVAEGVSSGCFVLATMAELFGSGRYSRLIRSARYIAFASLVPCPPLLIADLGRPERFHHMLRIVKPSSPMSLGAWALLLYGQPAALLALAELAGLTWMPTRLLSLVGLPFAFFLVAYPGILLSTTSIPVWAHTRFLGPLLGASSMASAASALAIATALDPQTDEQTRSAVRRIEMASQVCETVALAAYLRTAGPAAAPLTTGRHSRLLRYGAFAAGIAAPALIGAVIGISRKKHSRAVAVISGLLGLAGSLALKWAIVHAGRDSAEDPSVNRQVTRADAANPGWKPSTHVRTGPGYAPRAEA